MSLSMAWVICRHTLKCWIHHPSYLIAANLPSCAFLLLGFLASSVVSYSPVALVTLDRDAKGEQMRQIFHGSDVFRLTDASPQQAQYLYDTLQVAAVITIPGNFTQRVETYQPVPIDVSINNLNLDFTNDIRRSVPDAITQFYQAQGTISPLKVTTQETYLRSHDVELFQYNLLPTIVLILTINGLVNASVTTAREFETQSIQEVLLSPVSNFSLGLGKVLAFFLIAFMTGGVFLALGTMLGWIHPNTGFDWFVSLVAIALMSLFAASVGVIFGVWMKRVQSAHVLATNFSIFFFFLAGGIGVLAFAPDWLQTIAAFIPLTYGRHALEMALFYHSSDQLLRDILILFISALLPLGGVMHMVRR